MNTAENQGPDQSELPPRTLRTRLIRIAYGPDAADRAALTAPTPAGTDRRWRIGLTLGLVGAGALAAGLGWPLWQQHRTDAAGAAGQRAANRYAEALTSIDSDHLDESFANVVNGATGDFKETYSKASEDLRRLLIAHRATAKGTVVGSAIQSQNRHQVVVLVLVDQVITNTERPDPRVDRPRMKLTMDHIDDRWLASKVELP